ncbi:MAG: GNAT family N-acetyltransferase [Chloroflexota bacterium]
MIRKATPQDTEFLQTFISGFVDSGEVLPRTLDELEGLLPNCFVAEHEGEIVGTAVLEIYSWKLAEIRSLCVSPKVQGLGYGKRLVRACLDLAAERDIREVMAITRSEQFFVSCGFDYTLPNLKKALFIQTTANHPRNDLSGNNTSPSKQGEAT